MAFRCISFFEVFDCVYLNDLLLDQLPDIVVVCIFSLAFMEAFCSNPLLKVSLSTCLSLSVHFFRHVPPLSIFLVNWIIVIDLRRNLFFVALCICARRHWVIWIFLKEGFVNSILYAPSSRESFEGFNELISKTLKKALVTGPYVSIETILIAKYSQILVSNLFEIVSIRATVVSKA